MQKTKNNTEDFILKIHELMSVSKCIEAKPNNKMHKKSGYLIPLWANFIKDYVVPRELKNISRLTTDMPCASFTKPDLHLVSLTAIFLGILSADENKAEDWNKDDQKNLELINSSPNDLQTPVARLFRFEDIKKNKYLEEVHPGFIEKLRKLENSAPTNQEGYQVIRAVEYLSKKLGITPIEFDRVMYLFGSCNFSGLNGAPHEDRKNKPDEGKNRYRGLSETIEKYLSEKKLDGSLWEVVKKHVIEIINDHPDYKKYNLSPVTHHHLYEYISYPYQEYRQQEVKNNPQNDENLYLHFIDNRYASGSRIDSDVKDGFKKAAKTSLKILLDHDLDSEDKVVKILEHLSEQHYKDRENKPPVKDLFKYAQLLAKYKLDSNGETILNDLKEFYQINKKLPLNNAKPFEDNFNAYLDFENIMKDKKKYSDWLDDFKNSKRSSPAHPIWGRNFIGTSAALSLAGNLVHFFEIYKRKFEYNHEKLYDFLKS